MLSIEQLLNLFPFDRRSYLFSQGSSYLGLPISSSSSETSYSPYLLRSMDVSCIVGVHIHNSWSKFRRSEQFHVQKT